MHRRHVPTMHVFGLKGKTQIKEFTSREAQLKKQKLQNATHHTLNLKNIVQRKIHKGKTFITIHYYMWVETFKFSFRSKEDRTDKRLTFSVFCADGQIEVTFAPALLHGCRPLMVQTLVGWLSGVRQTLHQTHLLSQTALGRTLTAQKHIYKKTKINL